MSDFNWCHNPSCHTIQTQSRIRGTGDNKVLRTRRIKTYGNDCIWTYFCNQSCLMQFLNNFAREVANIRPVREASEKPIKVRTEKYENYRYRWNGNEHTREPYQATRKIIENSS